MERKTCAPRENWQERLQNDGLIWHTIDGIPYWNEGVYYEMSQSDIAAIKAATEELYTMLLAAGNYVIENKLFDLFNIPDFIVPKLVSAWQKEPPALNYGRFDFGYNGDGKPKLFEFNCDTPTSLVEAASVQWTWKEDVFPNLTQANEIYEYLRDKWKDIINYLPSIELHVMASNDPIGEDAITATYMAELATAAGMQCKFIRPEDIGWDKNRLTFVDLDNKAIRTLYKLYPWEWMVRESFGKMIPQTNINWIEPIWKMMWSNKAILTILWHLYPNHPYLLEASVRPLERPYVVKPIFGREGRGVRFGEDVVDTDVHHLLGPVIYQERFDIKKNEGGYPIIGSWLVDGYFAGMGIREGEIITGNTSRFAPHVVV